MIDVNRREKSLMQKFGTEHLNGADLDPKHAIGRTMSALNSIILSLATALRALGVLLLVACLFTRLPGP